VCVCVCVCEGGGGSLILLQLLHLQSTVTECSGAQEKTSATVLPELQKFSHQRKVLTLCFCRCSDRKFCSAENWVIPYLDLSTCTATGRGKVVRPNCRKVTDNMKG